MTKTLVNCLRIPFSGEEFLDGSIVNGYFKLMENATDLLAQKRIDYFDYGNNSLRKYSDKELGIEFEEELDVKKDYAFTNIKNAKKISANLSNYEKMFNEKCTKIESEYFVAIEKTNEERKKVKELESKTAELKENFYSKFKKKSLFEKVKLRVYFWKNPSKEEFEESKEKLLLEKEINHSIVELKAQKASFENQNSYTLGLQKNIKELTRAIDVVIETKNNLSNLENFYKSYLESFD